MTDPLHDALITTVERHRLWAEGSTVVIAVSGGQDSMALLHALHALRDRWRLKLLVAHYNHRLRGEEADEDAEFVVEAATRLSIPVKVGSGDVAGAAKRTHRSKQEAARKLRWGFLDDIAASAGVDRIALGHTLDDHLETVLLNILRGAGIDGLRGLPPRSEDRVRPLIDVPRSETGAYCERHGVAYRLDRSNLSMTYTRNRVREELLPYLAQRYSPSVRDAITRLSRLASDDATFLSEETQRRFDRIAVSDEQRCVALPLPALRAEPPAIQRRLVRLAIEQVRGTLQDVGFETVEALLRAVTTAPPVRRFQLTLPPGDTKLEIDRDRLLCREVEAPCSAIPVCITLRMPGVTQVSAWGLEIAAEILPPELPEATERMVAAMDQDAIRGELTVRSRRAGDRLRPLGMAGARKVQDILTDRKVPRTERDRVPIIADEEGVVWVAGHALAERVRLRPQSSRAIRIEIRPLSASDCTE